MTRTNGSLPHTFLTVNLAGENQLTAPCWARTVYNRSRWHRRGIMESSASMTTTKRAVMSWEERQDADSFRAERARARWAPETAAICALMTPELPNSIVRVTFAFQTTPCKVRWWSLHPHSRPAADSYYWHLESHSVLLPHSFHFTQ